MRSPKKPPSQITRPYARGRTGPPGNDFMPREPSVSGPVEPLALTPGKAPAASDARDPWTSSPAGAAGWRRVSPTPRRVVGDTPAAVETAPRERFQQRVARRVQRLASVVEGFIERAGPMGRLGGARSDMTRGCHCANDARPSRIADGRLPLSPGEARVRRGSARRERSSSDALATRASADGLPGDRGRLTQQASATTP
jgi:hypothetical protein